MEKKTSMRAVYVESPGDRLYVKEVPIPTPEYGQVLVKVEATPINPSDYHYARGEYRENIEYPFMVGIEGSGIVIESGGGLSAWRLKGKRVCCITNPPGMWAEYAICEAGLCVPLEKDVSFDEGASSFINPYSAAALVNIAKDQKHEAIIQTAAFSAMGKMILRYCVHEGINNYRTADPLQIKTINIVRKDEQKKELEDLGATIVLNQNDSSFENDIKSLSKIYNARFFIDTVGGDLPGVILKNMPDRSECVISGLLSQQTQGKFDFVDMLATEKKIRGFSLIRWVEDQNMLRVYNIKQTIKKHFKTIFKTDISRNFSLEEVNEAIDFYRSNMNKGRVVLNLF